MAADGEPQGIHSVSRRGILRGALLAGAGVATVGAVSAGLPGTANAATPDPQVGWGFCYQCNAMFWVAQQGSSWCAGSRDNRHAFGQGGYNYGLPNSETGLSSQTNPQAGWRYCTLCRSLCWGGNGRPCAGNDYGHGYHSPGATIYDLYFGIGVNSTSQPQAGWRYCGLCSLLYYQGPSGNSAGACIAAPRYPDPSAPSGPHTAASSTDYSMYHYGTL